MKSDMESKLNSGEHHDIHRSPFGLKDIKKVDNGSKKKIPPKIMGIINCTPDSYYDGGTYDPIEQGHKLIADGADLLDIGGESTKPGHTPVPATEEWHRIEPTIRALSPLITLSVDTHKPEVAEKAIEAGAHLVNDIRGAQNPEMRRLIIQKDVPVVVTYNNRATPLGTLINDIECFFKQQVETLLREGCQQHQIILDPGVGFVASPDHNFLIIKKIERIQQLGFPILVGISRKSFIQKALGRGVHEVLAATLSLNTRLLEMGVDIIRVHDVREHRDIVQIQDRLLEV